jgi:hypothetical protein
MGKFWGEILLMGTGYLYYSKGNLELWLVLDQEVHVQGYLRN